MADDFAQLDTVLACLKKMETTLSGLRQIRRVLSKGTSRYKLDELIVEMEQSIEEIKRKIVQ